MGQRIVLSCEKCGFQKTMSVGSGLMSNNVDVITSCLDKEDAVKWQQLNSAKKISFFRARQKVYYCGHCNDLFCQLSVDAELIDGDKVVLGNRCEKCGNEMREINPENHIICPICNGGELSRKQIGLWD